MHSNRNICFLLFLLFLVVSVHCTMRVEWIFVIVLQRLFVQRRLTRDNLTTQRWQRRRIYLSFTLSVWLQRAAWDTYGALQFAGQGCQNCVWIDWNFWNRTTWKKGKTVLMSKRKKKINIFFCLAFTNNPGSVCWECHCRVKSAFWTPVILRVDSLCVCISFFPPH